MLRLYGFQLCWLATCRLQVKLIPEINATQILQTIDAWTKSLSIGLPQIDSNFINQYQDQILSFLNNSISWLGKIGLWVLSVILSLPFWVAFIIVVVFSTYYFSRDLKQIKQNICSIFSDKTIRVINRTWIDGIRMFGKYVRSYLLVYLVTGIQSLVIFLLLGVPYPFIWSIVVAIFDVMPILGPGAIYLPMAAYYLIAGKSLTALFLALSWILITVVRHIVEPRIVARSIDIHPLSILGIIFISIQTGNIKIMLFLIFLLIFYNLLKNANILSPLFILESKKTPKST